jgi:ATP-binding cassette subfamily G (WHITE) protein 2 (SNQ2)
MSEGYPLADIREEASSSGFISRQASDPTLNNEKRHHEHEHPPHAHHHEPLERRTSKASRVSVDFFDPEGMVQLQRTLTGQGNKNAARPESPESASSYSTGHTLTVDPDDFDLERMIRSIVRRYAACSLFSLKSIDNPHL